MERAGEGELSKGVSSLLPAVGITIPGFPAAPSELHKEEEHDSLSPSHDIVKAEEYKLDTVSKQIYTMLIFPLSGCIFWQNRILLCIIHNRFLHICIHV